LTEDHASSAIRAAPVDVDIRGVNLSYGANHVLRGVDLRVEPGEFFAFLGPSGCGKTMLLRLIAGFNVADSGSVTIGGVDVGGLPPWKRDVGMVFQSYALWPHMSVRANVAFGPEEQRLPRAEIARRVEAALDMVGLAALAHRKPSQLSGGQQQRVALARAIAARPRVLLLDEPLSNLDAKMRVQVRGELRELQQRLGITTIFVTHDQEEANAICDRVAVMNEGAIQQVGAPMELYARPANLFVAHFLGAANIVSGEFVDENGARVFDMGDGARLPVAPDAAVSRGAKFVFRPQDARFGVAAPGEFAIPTEILGHEFLGASVRYRARLGKAEALIDAPFHSTHDLLKTGAPATLVLPRDAGLWLEK